MGICPNLQRKFIVLFSFQALQCDLIPDLLALLDSPLRDQSSPSATKALIVKALKAMTHSLLHGEEVTSILKVIRLKSFRP